MGRKRTIKLPEKVEETLKELKKEYNKHALNVRVVKGNYYVYQVYTRYDRLLGNLPYSLYIGKIEENGIFVKPHRKKWITKHVKTVDGYIKSKASEEREAVAHEKKLEDIKILSELAVNSRSSFKEIGRTVGLSTMGARQRVKKLEEKYGVVYTLDTHLPENLGFSPYIVTIKFKSGKPSAESIKKLLEDSLNVQFAAMTSGAYDVFIYVLFENPRKLELWIYEISKNDVFRKYPTDWNVTYFLPGQGVIPLRDKFFDIIKDKVWHRTKETPKIKPGQIYNRQYATMKELNKNSKIPFQEIDRIYGLRRGMAAHTFHELIDNGTIRKATISVQNTPMKYLAMIEMYQTDMERFEKSRKKWLLYACVDRVWSNNIIVDGDIGSPRGILVIAPIYADGELEKMISDIKAMFGDEVIQTAIITDALLGMVCVNKIDPLKDPIAHMLKRDYNMTEEDIRNALFTQSLKHN